MKIIKVKNYEEMSEVAAKFIIDAVKENPKLNLGLATGGTPVGMYKLLVDDHKENNTSYENVKSFNLDEYIGLPQDHEQTYYTFMHENLFDHVNFKEENVYVPNGYSDNGEEKAKEFEQLLIDNPIDLQLLGLGTNGHIGFNEPGADFEGLTSIVDLSNETIEANARYFEGNEDLVPTTAISMGIGSILRAKKILLIVSGANKAEVIRDLVEGPVTNQLPGSILQNHNDVTIVVDEDAAKLLSK